MTWLIATKASVTGNPPTTMPQGPSSNPMYAPLPDTLQVPVVGYIEQVSQKTPGLALVTMARLPPMVKWFMVKMVLMLRVM